MPFLPDLSLLLFALPLLIAPWLVPVDRLGAAASRVVVAGLGLGALLVATGSLQLPELSSWAAREGAGTFAALTFGFTLTGAALPVRTPGGWRAWLPGFPLLLGILALVPAAPLWGELALGAGLGLLPALVGRVVVRAGKAVLEETQPPIPCGLGPLALAAAAVVLVTTILGGPVVVGAVGLASLLLLAGWRSRGSGHRLQWPVAAVVGALGLLAFTWLALTVAGDPLVRLHGYAANAPLSPAGERLLATFLVVGMLGTFAPWPLHRLGDARPTMPLAIALTQAAAVMVVPDAMREWWPLLTMLLVPSAVIAVGRRQWEGAAGALAALAAMRPGPVALAGALAVVLWPTLLAVRPAGRWNSPPGERVTFLGIRLGVSIAALGAALVVVAVLHDEVVLGTLLAIGLASTAALADRSWSATATPRPPTSTH